MATVKSVLSGNNFFWINHNIRCRSKLLLLEFLKCVLVLSNIGQKLKISPKRQVLAIFIIAEIHKIDLEDLYFRI